MNIRIVPFYTTGQSLRWKQVNSNLNRVALTSLYNWLCAGPGHNFSHQFGLLFHGLHVDISVIFMDPCYPLWVSFQYVHFEICYLGFIVDLILIACSQAFVLMAWVYKHFANKHSVDPQSQLTACEDYWTISVTTFELQVCIVLWYELLLCWFE